MNFKSASGAPAAIEHICSGKDLLWSNTLKNLKFDVESHLSCHSNSGSSSLSAQSLLILNSVRSILHSRDLSVAELTRVYKEMQKLESRAFQTMLKTCAMALGLRASELPDLSVFCDKLGEGTGPEMIVIPSGRFLLGSSSDEPDRDNSEGPRREITFPRRFCLSRYLVTFDEFDEFCRATSRTLPKDRFWGRGCLPVILVNWNDAVSYCEWLSEMTRESYRLPSEAEWEYACRAGTATSYPWGDHWDPEMANGSVGGPERTTLVGSYPGNNWGLCDMIGNVREWVRDGWRDSYAETPDDGSAQESDDEEFRVVRGGAWFFYPRRCRSAFRDSFESGVGVSYGGFRVARNLR